MEESGCFDACGADPNQKDPQSTPGKPNVLKKARLLCVIGSMDTGGSERQLIGLLNHLTRERFEPMLYAIHRTGRLLSEVPRDVPVFSSDDLAPIRWNWPGRLHALQVRHLAHTIREQKVDLVYDRTFHATLVAGTASQRARCPHICTIVSNPEDDLKAAGRFAGPKRHLLCQAYRKAAKVVTVSDDLRDKVIAYYGLPSEQVMAVRNWLDLKRIDQLADASAPVFSPNRFHVVATGRLAPPKGYPFLLEATKDVAVRRGRTSLLVHILGEGPEEKALKQYVAEQGLERYVCFEGLQINPLPFVKAANLFCLPSLFEGMPNALLEAMACRVPTLATDCPTGPREVLDGGRLGRLVPPGNATALADAIEDAMLNRATWLEFVERARRHVEQCYGPDMGLHALQSLFLDTLGCN